MVVADGKKAIASNDKATLNRVIQSLELMVNLPQRNDLATLAKDRTSLVSLLPKDVTQATQPFIYNPKTDRTKAMLARAALTEIKFAVTAAAHRQTTGI